MTTCPQASPSAADEARTVAVLDSMVIGYLTLDEDWRITYVNVEGRRVLGAVGQDLTGQVMWDLFPASVGTVYETNYRHALATGRTVTFDAYYPEPLNSWFEIRAVPQGGGLALYFVDISARRDAEDAAALSAARMLSLSRVTLALAEARDVADLVTVMAERGLAALGADGGSVAVPDPADPTHLLSYITANFGADTRLDFGRLPLAAALPVAVAASTGQPVLLPDRAACEAFSAHVLEANTATGCQAWASMPLRADGRVIGVLTAGWEDAQLFDAEQLDLLGTFAAQCAQALERFEAREAERTASAAVARFSETVQRSLLSSPAQPEHLQIAVRYSPAAAEVQVGGDWYDAFVTAAGATDLVIGDVTGHDRHAAAAMGQLRNLLRGIAFTVPDAPAAVLSALDRAAEGLDVGAMASIVLLSVEEAPALAPAGSRLLRWSNAGHPPPLLLEPGAAPRFLTTPPDLLVGVDPGTRRHDHTALLAPGATVLLYTDGLVERRDAHLQSGLDWLAGAVADLAHLGPEEICDALLAAVGGGTEDDVALLALRIRPELVPRAAAAGPADPRAALALEPDSSAARRARAFVTTCCRGAGLDEDACDTAVLLTSEVVTNAFLHGRSRVRLAVTAGASAVRVEVGDDNSRHPVIAARDDGALDGRGMALVAELATTWGVRDEDHGKTVWFEVTAPGD